MAFPVQPVRFVSPQDFSTKLTLLTHNISRFSEDPGPELERGIHGQISYLQNLKGKVSIGQISQERFEFAIRRFEGIRRSISNSVSLSRELQPFGGWSFSVPSLSQTADFTGETTRRYRELQRRVEVVFQKAQQPGSHRFLSEFDRTTLQELERSRALIARTIVSLDRQRESQNRAIASRVAFLERRTEREIQIPSLQQDIDSLRREILNNRRTEGLLFTVERAFLRIEQKMNELSHPPAELRVSFYNVCQLVEFLREHIEEQALQKDIDSIERKLLNSLKNEALLFSSEKAFSEIEQRMKELSSYSGELRMSFHKARSLIDILREYLVEEELQKDIDSLKEFIEIRDPASFSKIERKFEEIEKRMYSSAYPDEFRESFHELGNLFDQFCLECDQIR